MKKKFLVALGCLSMLVGLASCNLDSSSTTVTETEDNSLTTTEAKSNYGNYSSKTSLAYDPVYVHYDVDFGTTIDTTKREVSDTVEDIYGSVVSIVASNTSSAAAGSGVLFA